jgi:hypothetical protein
MAPIQGEQEETRQWHLTCASSYYCLPSRQRAPGLQLRQVFLFLAGKIKAERFGCIGIDAERMKRRMSWTLRLYASGSFEDFQTAVTAVLEHHFNNHDHCGTWCKAKYGSDAEKKELRFRCKTTNHAMYLLFKSHHDQFMQEDSLRDLHHPHNTNHVEAFNKLITKFLPKDRTYCKTIENKARIHLAMCIQSVRYRRFYRRLFWRTGIRVDTKYTPLYLRSEDQMKAWRKFYRRKPVVKIARMRNLYQNMREETKKQEADKRKGLQYKSGLAGPHAKEANQDDGAGESAKKQGSPCCPHCKSVTHLRRTNKLCVMNPKNIAAKQKMDENTKLREGK